METVYRFINLQVNTPLEVGSSGYNPKIKVHGIPHSDSLLTTRRTIEIKKD